MENAGRAQAGLRLEQTGLKGEQRENPEVPESSFSRQYTNLFPSIFLSYKLDSTGTRSLTLSASRRINRPNYQQLNPFLFYLDNYSYTSGNPQLLPAYPQQFELKYQHNTIWGLSFQYNQFRNIIFQTTQAVGDIFITRPGNIANGKLLSLSAYASYNPFLIWTFMASGGFVHLTILPTELYGQALDARLLTGRINVTNQLKLGKTWQAECSLSYTGPSINGQRRSQSLYRINAGIRKSLWSNKASINLMVEDWLRSWVQREQIGSLQGATEFRTSRADTRRIGLAFAYRFGKQTRNRSYSDAAQEEKGRIH
ncbi:outer membrane beta-barrel family protein [Siphonobacter sp. BAB-5405]|uniref:outer membrane beta-barrel family protein n=1 Tax=Siphonobacter sp. BAB-5405 TaxID=1864825 RepID=UPI0013048BE8|nr:outer membrane beta-barrel family protein [Siphonobacter sp. BAB-5405]